MEKVDTLRQRLWFFYDNNLQVFIKDYKDNYYFAKIKNITETHVTLDNFKGKRIHMVSHLPIIDIVEVDEYREVGI